MPESMLETFRETGEIASELQRKALEAQARGDSRRSFFRASAALAGSTALGAAGLKVLQPATALAAHPACSSSFQEILDIAATAELLAVTFYYNALENTASLPAVNSAANRNYFQAALTQEYIHEETLVSLGAKPLATQFYFPEHMFMSEAVFFATSEQLETYFIGAYLAAAREFSGLISRGITTANPIGIGLAVQTAGVECEHRALLRVAANVNPPNNRLYELAVVRCVEDAAQALTPFLQGGSGFSTSPRRVPRRPDVETITAPYDFRYFPPVHIV